MRQKLIDEIKMEVILTAPFLGKSKLDDSVIQALNTVDRHKFVVEELQSLSYENRPLPIGYGQTISQPYIVAIMTDLLQLTKDSVVLEIGTGSGYQAAVLAEIVKHVYTLEIIKPLSIQAKNRLQELQYHNITVANKDGHFGWKEHAPFDAIIITAAATDIPQPLIAQLKPGGIMIIPVGAQFHVQHLILVKKSLDNKITTEQILPVQFVPLVAGGHGDE